MRLVPLREDHMKTQDDNPPTTQKGKPQKKLNLPPTWPWTLSLWNPEKISHQVYNIQYQYASPHKSLSMHSSAHQPWLALSSVVTR